MKNKNVESERVCVSVTSTLAEFLDEEAKKLGYKDKNDLVREILVNYRAAALGIERPDIKAIAKALTKEVQ